MNKFNRRAIAFIVAATVITTLLFILFLGIAYSFPDAPSVNMYEYITMFALATAFFLLFWTIIVWILMFDTY